jgi:dUTP pyrophosphatase
MLSGDEIARRLIVPGAGADQWQPNGVDLTVDALWRFAAPGQLGRSNSDRLLAEREDVLFEADGWAELAAGSYGLRFGELVRFPLDRGGLVFPRSSLLRMGAHIPTAVWDAGYEGHGEGLLLVTNAHGLRLQRGARVAQLVVFRLSSPAASGYSGQYQGETFPAPPG